MNKTTMALITKFLMTLVAALVSFGLVDRNPWVWVFMVSLIGTLVNYVVGDLFVLPKFGNLIASIGDGLMGALLAYIVNSITTAFDTSVTSLALFAVIVMVGEYFFHQYLLKSEQVAP